jgi:S1-C subfamily serine protease
LVPDEGTDLNSNGVVPVEPPKDDNHGYERLQYCQGTRTVLFRRCNRFVEDSFGVVSAPDVECARSGLGVLKKSGFPSICRTVALAIGIGFVAQVLVAERATSPKDGSVFIRVVGKLQAEYSDIWERSIEEQDVQIGTGTGFVISSFGHILTNYHVISDEELLENIAGVDVELRLEVERIEVVFPTGNPAEPNSGSVQRFTATVDAVDPELDLAVLSISAPELPYLPFGDSEAVDSSQPVQVFGFPFGAQVEVGKARVPDIVPRVSVSRGNVSAKRTDDQGNTRYLQTSATVNPGNSGGPMLDSDGFVLGVIRMKLMDGDGIGFAIPINVVKDFLGAHGLDQLLPVERMRLGPTQALLEKGLGLRLPEGHEDLSPTRVRIDTGRDSAESVPLVIDRVASPMNLQQLEQALLSGEAFETFIAQAERQSLQSGADSRALLGKVRGSSPQGGPPLIMIYALVDLGAEKVIARFLGRDEQVAFNASILEGALQSLEVSPLLTEEIDRPLEVEWNEVPFPSPRAPNISGPAGWLREEGAPFPCVDVSPPDSALRLSPPGDFTVAFLAGFRAAGPEAEEAAAACADRRGTMGDTSYASWTDYLGVTYRIEGIFIAREDGLLQFEVVVPEEKFQFVRNTFRTWIDKNL